MKITSLKIRLLSSENVRFNENCSLPCTVDPNRKDVFVSFHGNTDVRRLSSAEYYNMNGSANRLKLEQDRKKEQGVQTIETNIPSVKSAVTDKYITHVKYMMQHKDTLFSFYNFQTARVKWCNYIRKQRALQDAVNILINGSKKYNKGRRKKTRKNKKKQEKKTQDSCKVSKQHPSSRLKTKKKSNTKSEFPFLYRLKRNRLVAFLFDDSFHIRHAGVEYMSDKRGERLLVENDIRQTPSNASKYNAQPPYS
ncbi:uncharacterized protein EV154DRAFT_486696 [Mucor mucedo]|uniref:uncharacterized protein n=1 Tax=Mucor mucedo TaxID=29922 RepID=UPI0022204993|nr:uncharacterized protein EV154DRAFT_486696 [Mucor mucedo]KAI7875521.1 hypothetical protein EV154DRAFT_486696 [Mucor mucedo]